MKLGSTFTTLRGRLTLWYILSTIVIFILLASLFSGLLWYSLYTQVDHHVHIVTGQAEQITKEFEDEERAKLLTNLVGFEGMVIAIIADNGQPIYKTHSTDMSPLTETEFKQLLSESHTHGYHPFHFTLNDIRYGVAEVEIDGTTAHLAVGNSVKFLRQTFTQLMAIVLGVMLTTLLPFAFIGHRLLKKYLYPLEVVATTAEKVKTSRQLSTRVTGLTLTDELQSIVHSFNNMLSHLEQIFQTEHDFFSQAAHTLKTPLAVLRAKVEGMTKESQANKQSMLKVIDDAVDTIQDLLLISRVESGMTGNKEKVSLSEVVQELVELAESLAQEKEVKVAANVQEDIYLNADPRLLRRALGNLVHNALEYVNREGEVSIRLSNSNEVINFTITNTGEGIDKKDQARIFERFFRGANAKQEKGSGLGLAIAKAIVESHHGKVEFNSNKGVTRVQIVF